MTTPRATIRLQFNSRFSLDNAIDILPYLSELGVSHIYASPLLSARHGSAHGYDVIDPTSINPELGGRPALERLSAALRSRDMGLILDIVPNHMAASHENPWWFDVLQWGKASPYAKFFDINWHPSDIRLRNKILLPLLGDNLANCLRRAEIRLQLAADRRSFTYHYFGHCLPLAPSSYAFLLMQLAAEMRRQIPAVSPPPEISPQESGGRQEFFLFQDKLSEAIHRNDAAYTHILSSVNTPEEASFRFHNTLLSQQHYELSHWRESSQRINWRRFFDINDLVALQIERPEVFSAYHSLIFDLYREGIIDGLRIDHIDGLADPRTYCRRLRRELKRASGLRSERDRVPYIIVEKILDWDELLSQDWEVDGNTGYDYMDEVSAVLHDGRGASALSDFWSEISGQPGDFIDVARQCRREILERLFSRQLDELVLLCATEGKLSTTASTLGSLRRSFIELLAHFTRYRTYSDKKDGLSAMDVRVLSVAERSASGTLSGPDRDNLSWICSQFRRHPLTLSKSVTRFQQLSATLAAKAVEDTAFYRYGRLLSRNEVGSNPDNFAIDADAFHALCKRRHRHFPNSLLATATHDHKRGEDLRARLAVLSECPLSWVHHASAWLKRHAAHEDVPDAVKLMVYQTLIGAWPPGQMALAAAELLELNERLQQWLIKSQREAKERTSWAEPDAAYEQACTTFLQSILNPIESETFLNELLAFVSQVATAGAINSFTQLTLKMTCPGIPDLYQGREWWDFSLVDPDNRLPVDYAVLREALNATQQGPDLLKSWQNGYFKQWLTARLLQLRRDNPELFSGGGYLPLAVSGPLSRNLIAFIRLLKGNGLIVISSRLSHRLLGGVDLPLVPAIQWKGTSVHLPVSIKAGPLWDELNQRSLDASQGTIPVSDALGVLPIALLRLDAR